MNITLLQLETIFPLPGWTGRDMSTRNLYLVARMFWCDDISRSGVCWGTFDPEFRFLQVHVLKMYLHVASLMDEETTHADPCAL